MKLKLKIIVKRVGNEINVRTIKVKLKKRTELNEKT